MKTECIPDEIIYAQTSKYQRIVLTHWRGDVRLYLDGNLQFSSVDEYRYHEALIHPVMNSAKKRDRVLILGGGDGLGVREVLKYDDVKSITLVDLDPAITEMFKNFKMLKKLNKDSLNHEKVTVINKGASVFLKDNKEAFDVIIVDLPDPNEAVLAKLYSKVFYRLVFKNLSDGGRMVTQSTSPYRARQTFWCIHNTIKASGETIDVKPYQLQIPTFGTWGFNIAAKQPFEIAEVPEKIERKFLTNEFLKTMFVFPTGYGTYGNSCKYF